MNEDEIKREMEAMADEDLGRMTIFVYLLIFALVVIVAAAALWWVLA